MCECESVLNVKLNPGQMEQMESGVSGFTEQLGSTANPFQVQLKTYNIRVLLIQANCYSQQLHKLHGIQYWSNLFSFFKPGILPVPQSPHPPKEKKQQKQQIHTSAGK